MDAKNMELNYDKQIIHTNREPGYSHVKMHNGADRLGALETKKVESDIHNKRPHVQTTSNRNISKLNVITQHSITSNKTTLSNKRHEDQYTLSVLDKNNTLTQATMGYYV